MVLQEFLNDAIDDVRSFGVDPTFSMRAVDGEREGISPSTTGVQKPMQKIIAKPPQVETKKFFTHPEDDKTLGPVLGKFVGTFRTMRLTSSKYVTLAAVVCVMEIVADECCPEGTGFNMIFRPRPSFTDFSEDNDLELNLTVETLQFMDSGVLANIPNKGFSNQPNIDLTGIPYQQTVSDKLNVNSGRADLPKDKIDLHFEQGIFLRVPATTSPDTSKRATLARMGSIPHGTTLNAQDFEPAPTPNNGKPTIPDANVTPFFIPTAPDSPGANVQIFEADMKKRQFQPFPNMTTLDMTGDAAKFRTPPNLTKFADPRDGTKVITFDKIKNPNLYLTEWNSTRDIVSNFVFNVQTKHPTLQGGGVANIGFLSAGPKPSPFKPGNANAVDVQCQYFVSSLRHKLKIPTGDWTSHMPPPILPLDDVKDQPGPQFVVQVNKRITQENQTIEVFSTQIQYSQNVLLNFGVLTWPHISVATLAPALPILIPSNHPGLQSLK